MAQFIWPPSASAGSNASVGANGATAPTSSTEVAGINPSGDLQPLQTNAAGSLITTSDPAVIQHVIVDSSALPTGAATQTTLSTVSTTLGSILLDLTNGTQVTQISNFPTTQPVSGTVTANQGTAGASPWLVDGSGHTQPVSGSVSVSNFPATQPISAASLPLPTGAATETTLSTINGKVTACNTGAVTISAAIPAGANNIGSTNALPTTPTAKTVTQAAVTVGTSAVRCTVSGSAPTAGRVSLVVTPDPASAAVFYIGSSSVTNSSGTRGVPIVAGQSFIANLDAGDYYIISSVAAQTVFIMEQA